MDLITDLLITGFGTVWDVLPLVVIVVGFQVLVIRQPIANPRRLAIGFAYVVLGLALFLAGLERALFPLGELLATELTDPSIRGASGESGGSVVWSDYYWVYLFAAAIGFTTTIAEPSLIAVAIKAREVSAGAITVWGLRIAVAVGVSIGVAVGAFRIVTGTPLHYFIIAGYVVVIAQTIYAPRSIIPLAYDSGGVTTSTVTVPVVAALGLGLASSVSGRNPVVDGFGLIAFASVFPIMAVLAYAQITKWMRGTSNC
ncbi:MAG: DUF1538 domain-containing protein [Gammaproteobacteria bacterium]|nr:DUF1538 domain-containing protein [Gammaproteobacteria bacterium]